MKKNFIEYHGCNLLYKDGTRQIVKKHCFKPTLYPFWKLSNDVTNSVGKSRRAQLKNKGEQRRNIKLSMAKKTYFT